MPRAGDDVAFGLENRCVPTPQIWPRVDGALARVGFRYGRERRTAALSGGEKQRLALAGVLALRPRLLLLDEPTANLDRDGAAALWEIVRGLSPRATIVLVEHRVDEAVALVDRVVAIEAGGGVVADGPPGEVFARDGKRLAAAGVWVPGPIGIDRRAAAPAGEALVRAEDATFAYPGTREVAIDAVDCAIHGGEALAVTGPNGSGKSTLALLLGGLIRPGAGRVTASEELAGPAGPDLWRWRARTLAGRVGTVFQDPEHQLIARSVEEELLFGPRRTGVPSWEARTRARLLLERLRLGHLARANPFTLSGGEQRRLSVAAALATRPRVLVLDEPTFGQDRLTFVELIDLLAEFRDAGNGLCFTSHDARFVEAIADRAVALDRGRSA